MGDIQLALCYRKGALEVEVIRAKGLLPKPGTKMLPGTAANQRAINKPPLRFSPSPPLPLSLSPPLPTTNLGAQSCTKRIFPPKRSA
jgi:hypothetical protein